MAARIEDEASLTGLKLVSKFCMNQMTTVPTKMIVKAFFTNSAALIHMWRHTSRRAGTR